MGKHKKNKRDDEIKKLKHYNEFYAAAPPGMIKEHREKPEDAIPDIPENKNARDFLATAPEKGLWMPLGKEVKVMRCWRCKLYGHRTGDRECPLFLSGNVQTDRLRWSHEDPMHDYVRDQDRIQKEDRVKELQLLLENSSSSDSSDSSSNSTDSEVSHRKQRKRKKHKAKTASDSDKNKHIKSSTHDKDKREKHSEHTGDTRNKHKHDRKKSKHKYENDEKEIAKKHKHDSDSDDKYREKTLKSRAYKVRHDKIGKHKHKKHRKEKHKTKE